MTTRRPAWYRTARVLGGVPWVPFDVAQALQRQVDGHQQRLQWAQAELNEARRALQVATRTQSQTRHLEQQRQPLLERIDELEQALQAAHTRLDAAIAQGEQARKEAEQARVEARELAERLQQEQRCEEGDPRLQNLAQDLRRIRDRTASEAAQARQQERVRRLQDLAQVYDNLRRALQASDDATSPWHQGYLAILSDVEAAFDRAGAQPLGRVGEPFDPQRHEAVAMVDAQDPEQDDRLVAVEQVGFALDDGTLVRPARVVVGRAA